MPMLKEYPPELKERAVLLAARCSLLAARDEDGGRRGACTRGAQQLGVIVDTLRGLVRRAEVDDGVRPGLTTSESERIADSSVKCRS